MKKQINMEVVENLGCSIQEFKILQSLGKGAFGEVFKAECLRDGYDQEFQRVFAIKKINRKTDKENGKKYAKDTKRRIDCEILIHEEVKSEHDHIVKLKNHFKDKNHWYLVLEYCARGSLKDYIAEEEKLPEKEACRLIIQLIDGVRFLHLKKIIHRDLSLRNVLLTDNCTIKIADFGFAYKLKHKTEKIKDKLGTPDFMAPEVYKKEPYNFKPDWWSVGCILYAMLYGTPPFKKKKDDGTPMYKLSFPRHASKEAKTLLRDWLKENPDSRLDFSSLKSYKNVLNYNFFKKCDSNKSGDSGMNSPSSCEISRSQSGQDTKRRNYNSNQKESQMYTKKHQFDNGYHDVDVTKSKDRHDRSKEKQAVCFSSKHEKSHESSHLQSGQDTQRRNDYNSNEKHFDSGLNDDFTRSTYPHGRSKENQQVSLSSKQKKSYKSLNSQSGLDTQKKNYYNSNERHFERGLNDDFTRSADPHDRSKEKRAVSLSSKQKKGHESSHLQSGQDTQRRIYCNSNEKHFERDLDVDYTTSTDPHDRSKQKQAVSLSSKQKKSYESSLPQSGLDTQRGNYYNSNEKGRESGLNVDFTRSSDPHHGSKENQQISLCSKQKKSSSPLNRLKTEFQLLPSRPKSSDPVQPQKKYPVENRRAIVSSQRYTDLSEGDTFNSSIGLNKTPLDARSLKSYRRTDEFPLRNKTYSILKNGEVCVEVTRKKKKYLLYALFISQDCKKITVFKPEKKEKILMSREPPGLPQGIKSVSLENLPEKYRKDYEDAKKFVHSVRAGHPELEFPNLRPPVPTSCNDSFGKKTDSPEQSRNIKTRQSSLLSGGSEMKSFDAIMNTNDSPYQNSFQNNISTPLSCEKGKDTVCKRIPENFPNFEFIRFANEAVLCLYRDGCQYIEMYINLRSSEVFFSDRSKNSFDIEHFRKRYRHDICAIRERAMKNPESINKAMT